METLKPFSVQLKAGEKRRHLLGDAPPTAGFRSGEVILEAGESVGEHSTKHKEEVLVIFSGKAEVSTDKAEPFIAEAESLVYVPPKTTHNVKNIGTGTLRYVYIVAPVMGME